MNEGTPLLVAHQEESKSGTKRARAGTYLIIFIAGICFIHLGLDCGLPISSASGQDALRHASHSGSTSKVLPPSEAVLWMCVLPLNHRPPGR